MSDLTTRVVIACHTEERFASLVRAIVSAQRQELRPLEVIVAVDHNDGLCARLRAEVEGIEVVDHQDDRGASGTRNAGAALATGELIAFIDDDVQARPGWLSELTAPFGDPSVVGTGGMTEPAWKCPRPSWFPDEFGWVVGFSHAGLPVVVAPVRNVWSENMAVRREAFEQVGGFRRGFGKVGLTSRPEDTDLCIRIGASAPNAHWLYVPTAIVDHEVPPERATFAFFLRRCYSEGAGKIELSAHLGADRDLGDEGAYLLRTLPLGVARYARAGQLGRALAILAGAAVAGAGAGVSLLRAVIGRAVIGRR